MQLGRRHRRAIGLMMIAIAIGVAAFSPFRDSDAASARSDDSDAASDRGASIVATVSWADVTADVDRSDICVVAFDDDGDVVGGERGILLPLPGTPAAARWSVDGIAPGRYTVYVAPCVTPSPDESAWVEPQYLGDSDYPSAATWFVVAAGDNIDVGTIALHGTG